MVPSHEVAPDDSYEGGQYNASQLLKHIISALDFDEILKEMDNQKC